MHRNHRVRSRRRTALRIVLVPLLAALLSWPAARAQPVPPAASSAGRKVIVDAQDRAAIAELSRGAATLLVDYGSFQLWRVTEEQGRALGRWPSVAIRDDFDSLALRGRAVHTPSGAPAVPAELRQSRGKGPQLWMVQFVGPIKDSWLGELKQAGLRLVSYIPANAYVVWGDEVALAQLDALAARRTAIQWSGPYHPAYRLAPSLQEAARARPPGERVPVTVQLYTTALTRASVARLRALGGGDRLSEWESSSFTNLTLELPVAQLIPVAGWPDVFNIEPWRPPEKLDEVQGQILAGNLARAGTDVVPRGPGYLDWLASLGFPTDPQRYPVVDIVDDGIDQGDPNNVLHPDFHQFGRADYPDRVAYLLNCTQDPTANGAAGHGNINAGIFGAYNRASGFPYQDANGYRLGLGISPYGRIAGTKVFRNSWPWDLRGCGSTYRGLLEAISRAGADLTSNSWGSEVFGEYDATAQVYDELTRDASPSSPGNQEMLHIFAAGNTRADVVPTSIFSPGTAKNVLTVGATENVRADGIMDGCGYRDSDSADDIFRRSSRGPTKDGRSKPELVAPGVHIQGPVSLDPNYSGSAVCNPYYPPGQELYTWSTGTSHATPAVAGAASLVWEYYGRTMRPGHTPSPAMLKALLLTSTRHLTGVSANDTLPSPHQGWGGLDLGRLFDGRRRLLVDQEVVLTQSGQTYTIPNASPDPAQPLRVSLVWTDSPGSPTAGEAGSNNLDLEVTVDGVIYRGNVFNGATSVAGGGFDTLNNVEHVFLPAGTRGSVRVRVIARNIAGDGVPGVGDTTDQDFALVVSGLAFKQSYMPLVRR